MLDLTKKYLAYFETEKVSWFLCCGDMYVAGRESQHIHTHVTLCHIMCISCDFVPAVP